MYYVASLPDQLSVVETRVTTGADHAPIPDLTKENDDNDDDNDIDVMMMMTMKKVGVTKPPWLFQ